MFVNNKSTLLHHLALHDDGTRPRLELHVFTATAADSAADIEMLGCAWDVIEEISHVSISTSATFHAKYMEWFRETQYDEYVNPTDITKAEGQYSMLGFPGCVGSMDGVHLAQ